MTNYKGRVSPSRINTYMRCERRAYYQYILGIEPVMKPRPLIIGGAVHAVLAAKLGVLSRDALDDDKVVDGRWRDDLEETAQEEATRAINRAIKAAAGQEAVDPLDWAVVEAIARYYQPPISWQVLGVETRVKGAVPTGTPTKIVEGAQFLGFIDATVKDLVSGDIIIVEYKTTGAAWDAEASPSSYRYRLQGPLYHHQLQARFGVTPRVEYHVIEKPRRPSIGSVEQRIGWETDGDILFLNADPVWVYVTAGETYTVTGEADTILEGKTIHGLSTIDEAQVAAVELALDLLDELGLEPDRDPKKGCRILRSGKNKGMLYIRRREAHREAYEKTARSYDGRPQSEWVHVVPVDPAAVTPALRTFARWTERYRDMPEDRGAWLENRSQCAGQYGQPCPFVELCYTEDWEPAFAEGRFVDKPRRDQYEIDLEDW
jgi:hypothetical protein